MKEKNTTHVSPELVQFMSHHYISTISLLLKVDNENLLQMDGFGWRLMKEILLLRKI